MNNRRNEPPTHESFPGWPADKLEHWPIDRLIPYARNARTHSEAQVAQLAGSIREWGWTMPVLADEEGGLIAGHGRVLAARSLGLGQIPVLVARGWSEAKKRAYVLADNKLALNAGWDPEILRLELADLRAMGGDLNLIGFQDSELADIFADRGGGLTDPDHVPAMLPEPVSVPGDVWRLGRHRLACGDSRDTAIVGKTLAGFHPHLMVTDPPYGVEYDPKWRARSGISKNTRKMGVVANDDSADWRAAWDLFPGTVAYVWCASLQVDVAITALEACGFQRRSQIIWAKERFALSRGHYHWQHEPCWYAVKGTAHWCGDRAQTTIWSIPAREDSGHGHGTQKPVECMKRPILNNSVVGDAVYEPFCGSGTTIIAAVMTGRTCLAIELRPAYVDVAIRRWQDFAGEQAVAEESGTTFAAIAAARGVSLDGPTRAQA